jgi:hypothetical protein
MGPYLMEWEDGRVIVSTWDDVVIHPAFGFASIFKRWAHGWVAV